MGVELTSIYDEKIELTKEQEACVNYLGDRTLMVKGFAGAGKSVVLQATAKKIMEEYSEDKENAVLLLTYNNTLAAATKEMLDKNGEKTKYVRVSTLTSFLSDVYKDAGAPSFKHFMKATKFKKPSKTPEYFLEKAFKMHEEQYGHHRFHDNTDFSFWKEEFDWMKEMNVTSADMEYYLTLARKGRGGSVRMSSVDRVVAFQLFSFYESTKALENYGDWIDYALYIIRHPQCISDKYKYDYVLIDEAQDLSLAQMMAAIMFVNTRMVIAMDANQRIYNKNWTPKQLGIESTTKKLTKSMRTTKAIDNLAESLRSHNDINLDDDDKMLRAIPERDGYLPELAHFNNLDEEKKYVISLVKQVIASNNRCSIGIIAAKNAQIKFYGGWMADTGISHEIIAKDTTFSMASPGVKICNVYNAKGLEFDVVIIPQFQEGYFPYAYRPENDEDKEIFIVKARNLAYVAMTRAKQLLYITYNGNKGSRFISEMDKQYYKAVGEISGVSSVKKAIEEPEKPRSTLPPTVKPSLSTKDDYKNLTDFFTSKGLEVVDKRIHGGALWVVGTKQEIDPIVREAGKLFGAYGTYVDKDRSKALHNRAGWFTKCSK